MVSLIPNIIAHFCCLNPEFSPWITNVSQIDIFWWEKNPTMVQLSNPTCLRNRASAFLGRPFRRCRHPSCGRRAPRRAKPRKWRPGRGWMWIKAKNNLSTSTAFFCRNKNSFFKPDFIIGSTPICEFRDYCFWAVGDWSPCFDEMLSNVMEKLKKVKRAEQEKHFSNKRMIGKCSLRTMPLDDTNTSPPLT